MKNEKEKLISEFEMDLSSDPSSIYTRSKKGDGLKRPGLKTGVKNNIFFSLK